jgi:hypothetical protein
MLSLCANTTMRRATSSGNVNNGRKIKEKEEESSETNK